VPGVSWHFPGSTVLVPGRPAVPQPAAGPSHAGGWPGPGPADRCQESLIVAGGAQGSRSAGVWRVRERRHRRRPGLPGGLWNDRDGAGHGETRRAVSSPCCEIAAAQPVRPGSGIETGRQERQALWVHHAASPQTAGRAATARPHPASSPTMVLQSFASGSHGPAAWPRRPRAPGVTRSPPRRTNSRWQAVQWPK
jgi:hypothetical protein